MASKHDKDNALEKNNKKAEKAKESDNEKLVYVLIEETDVYDNQGYKISDKKVENKNEGNEKKHQCEELVEKQNAVFYVNNCTNYNGENVNYDMKKRGQTPEMNANVFYYSLKEKSGMKNTDLSKIEKNEENQLELFSEKICLNNSKNLKIHNFHEIWIANFAPKKLRKKIILKFNISDEATRIINFIEKKEISSFQNFSILLYGLCRLFYRQVHYLFVQCSNLTDRMHLEFEQKTKQRRECVEKTKRKVKNISNLCLIDYEEDRNRNILNDDCYNENNNKINNKDEYFCIPTDTPKFVCDDKDLELLDDLHLNQINFDMDEIKDSLSQSSPFSLKSQNLHYNEIEQTVGLNIDESEPLKHSFFNDLNYTRRSRIGETEDEETNDNYFSDEIFNFETDVKNNFLDEGKLTNFFISEKCDSSQSPFFSSSANRDNFSSLSKNRKRNEDKTDDEENEENKILKPIFQHKKKKIRLLLDYRITLSEGEMKDWKRSLPHLLKNANKNIVLNNNFGNSFETIYSSIKPVFSDFEELPLAYNYSSFDDGIGIAKINHLDFFSKEAFNFFQNAQNLIFKKMLKKEKVESKLKKAVDLKISISGVQDDLHLKNIEGIQSDHELNNRTSTDSLLSCSNILKQDCYFNEMDDTDLCYDNISLQNFCDDYIHNEKKKEFYLDFATITPEVENNKRKLKKLLNNLKFSNSKEDMLKYLQVTVALSDNNHESRSKIKQKCDKNDIIDSEKKELTFETLMRNHYNSSVVAKSFFCILNLTSHNFIKIEKCNKQENSEIFPSFSDFYIRPGKRFWKYNENSSINHSTLSFRDISSVSSMSTFPPTPKWPTQDISLSSSPAARGILLVHK